MQIMQLTQTIHLVPPLQGRSRKHVTQPTLPGFEIEQDQPVKVTNRQIAEVLSSVADMLASQNGNPYRIQAYRNAARGVLDLPEPAADILARGEALPIPGLGQRLRLRIAELVQLGTMTFQNGLYMQALPSGVRSLLTVEHVGVYTAIRLYEELGIDSIEKLWLAAQQKRIRTLDGFGSRSEARLKEAAEHLLQRHTRKQPLGGVA
ncbi:histidinol-phosphatase [Ktedonosporobacter rubrisoli]|uniref:Histidinol-phosphatase n=1 Tax=Ktedonosporobacter rubrisoli TaxID=2509675 RepID=A0A4P6JS95_KTERU|nr:helix-hairpin-helix domain-containing protein [Ktedonosporobacter rubrisoli]QBD77716.1 histidinol-phosphatase [Ktedonosporobacter rubrisoli]